MDTEIIKTVLLGGFNLVGILISGYVANSVVKYRIEQLEKKVDKHNNLIDRMYKVERDVALLKKDTEHLEDEFESK